MWELDKSEKFGDRWPEVKAILTELEDNYGIHMLDVNPGNVALDE